MDTKRALCPPAHHLVALTEPELVRSDHGLCVRGRRCCSCGALVSDPSESAMSCLDCCNVYCARCYARRLAPSPGAEEQLSSRSTDDVAASRECVVPLLLLSNGNRSEGDHNENEHKSEIEIPGEGGPLSQASDQRALLRPLLASVALVLVLCAGDLFAPAADDVRDIGQRTAALCDQWNAVCGGQYDAVLARCHLDPRATLEDVRRRWGMVLPGSKSDMARTVCDAWYEDAGAALAALDGLSACQHPTLSYLASRVVVPLAWAAVLASLAPLGGLVDVLGRSCSVLARASKLMRGAARHSASPVVYAAVSAAASVSSLCFAMGAGSGGACVSRSRNPTLAPFFAAVSLWLGLNCLLLAYGSRPSARPPLVTPNTTWRSRSTRSEEDLSPSSLPDAQSSSARPARRDVTRYRVLTAWAALGLALALVLSWKTARDPHRAQRDQLAGQARSLAASWNKHCGYIHESDYRFLTSAFAPAPTPARAGQAAAEAAAGRLRQFANGHVWEDYPLEFCVGLIEDLGPVSAAAGLLAPAPPGPGTSRLAGALVFAATSLAAALYLPWGALRRLPLARRVASASLAHRVASAAALAVGALSLALAASAESELAGSLVLAAACGCCASGALLGLHLAALPSASLADKLKAHT
eukprot:m51a1_g7904 hypothetical protein (643) ;mRNA; f:155918-157846